MPQAKFPRKKKGLGTKKGLGGGCWGGTAKKLRKAKTKRYLVEKKKKKEGGYCRGLLNEKWKDLAGGGGWNGGGQSERTQENKKKQKTRCIGRPRGRGDQDGETEMKGRVVSQ